MMDSCVAPDGFMSDKVSFTRQKTQLTLVGLTNVKVVERLAIDQGYSIHLDSSKVGPDIQLSNMIVSSRRQVEFFCFHKVVFLVLAEYAERIVSKIHR